jgi:excisionase family DNA binding protein
LFTKADAAKRLRVSEGFINKLIKVGHLKPLQVGKRQLIPVAELDRFVASLAA